jgi:hypothetical protein
MVLIVLSALVVCIASLSLGQAALRICGARHWSWMAAPVGISILMLAAAPARYLPGRAITTAVVITILVVASLVWCLRVPAHRPPLLGLVAAGPVAAFALVPFIVTGRGGTLGVAFDNDMAAHLIWASAYLSSAVARLSPLPNAYPLGPHAVAATLSAGLGARIDLAFAGFTLAAPVLSAWTALHALRRPSRLGPFLVATVVGMPYLVAAYYGEGAFKEVLQAQFVLASALWLDRPVPAAGRLQWAPLALIVAGSVSVYSVDGLPWLLAFLALWLAARAAVRIRRTGVRTFVGDFRGHLFGGAAAVGVLVLVLMPQLSQAKNFLSLKVLKSSLGNLAQPLSGWEAFGVWNNPDFRFGATPPFTGGMWTGLALALVIFGGFWAFQRKRWILPVAAGVSALIWYYSVHTQSPYVAAKALVILSPLLLLLAALPLSEHRPRTATGWWVIAPLLGIALLGRVSVSSLRALRISSVGSTSHVVELRSLRADVHGQATLFLGNDDFIAWELAGVPVIAPIVGNPVMSFPPNKAWVYGQPLDIDSVSAETINAADWVITTRDAAQSQLPPQLRLVRTTPDFELWHRVGTVLPRQILKEGPNSGARMNCRKPAIRKLVAGGGQAAIRKPPIVFPMSGLIQTGQTATVRLSLKPGVWDLETPYFSSRPVTISGPDGVLRHMPANLDRPGPRWPIGRIVVPSSGSVTLTVHAAAGWFSHLTPAAEGAWMTSIIANPVGTEHLVPLRQACGKYVDWYTTKK